MKKLNMKKFPLRLLGALLAVLLVLAVFPISAVATGTNEVGLKVDLGYPKGTYAIVGDKVIVTVSITENPGVASMFLTANYDTEAFELVSADLKSETFSVNDPDSWAVSQDRKSLGIVNKDTAGKVIFNWIYSGALNGSLNSKRNCEAIGAFAEFKLKVKNADLEDEKYKVTVTPDPENFFAMTETGTEAVTVTGLDKSVTVKKSYTVTYNANGGNGAPEDQKKVDGVALTLSETVPTRDGYKFLGWATTAEGTAMYQPGETYSDDKALTLFAVWQERAKKLKFTVSDGSGVAGGKVSVDLSLSFDSGTLVANKIELPLSFTGLSNVTLSDNTWIYDSGKLTWNGTAKEFKAGKLLTLTFDIPSGAAAGTTYTVSINSPIVSDSDYNYSASTQNGTVTVVDYILGDVNGDGYVNADDLTALARHVAKKEIITDNVRLAAADVTKNGSSDSDDLTKIARYIAKKDLEL